MTRRRRDPARRPVGLRASGPGDLLEWMRGAIARVGSSWPELAFIVLFIVFVKFAIDVLMSLR